MDGESRASRGEKGEKIVKMHGVEVVMRKNCLLIKTENRYYGHILDVIDELIEKGWRLNGSLPGLNVGILMYRDPPRKKGR